MKRPKARSRRQRRRAQKASNRAGLHNARLALSGNALAENRPLVCRVFPILVA